MNQALSQFRTEITNFYLVSLFNLVIAALAIAFGVQYMIAAVTGSSYDPLSSGLRILTGAIAMVCFGFGLHWLLSTISVFEGVETIVDALDSEGDSVSDDRITCLIVRMLSHYRERRDTFRTMIRVSTIGGICFLFLGITTMLKAVPVFTDGISSTVNDWILIPATLLMLGIATVSLLSSYYLSKFTRVYDQRLHEISESECTLQEKLGLGKE